MNLHQNFFLCWLGIHYWKQNTKQSRTSSKDFDCRFKTHCYSFLQIRFLKLISELSSSNSKFVGVFHDFPEQEDEDVKIAGDTCTTLVLRHNCLLPKVMEENWLRNSLFCSTCTIRGKMCRMIIDSGSCTSVISEEAVSKLALFMELHPASYRLAWLNMKTDVRITKIYVEFLSLWVSITKIWLYVMCLSHSFGSSLAV